MTKELSIKYKDDGNNYLKENHFEKAVEAYTKAIELDGTNEIFYSNRAQAHIKLENYGSAIIDASQSIELNQGYLKAYYRRGIAYTAILKYKDASRDFKRILDKIPNDANASKNYELVKKILKRQAFENAIQVDTSKSLINELEFNSLQVENSYTGPDLEIVSTKDSNGDLELQIPNLNIDYLKKMITLFKEGGRIPKKHAYAIVALANQIFKRESSLVEIGIARTKPSASEQRLSSTKKITVCGDTHGQFYDVLNIFNKFGFVQEDHIYLFNGDIVDRGSWSCEVALYLYTLKCIFPEQIFINRGNHETDDMNKVYGFSDECKYKYSEKLFKLFSESFNSLPFATLIGQEYLIMHGGLFSNDDTTLQDIKNIDRFKYTQPPKEGIEMELLWTDPQPEEGRSASKRGIGMQFGPDVTETFCTKNDLKAVIRSHELRMGGYEVEHNGRLITVFSAPNYCDSQGNLGAVINMTLDANEEYNLDFSTFEAVSHPNIKPMAYSNNFGY